MASHCGQKNRSIRNKKNSNKNKNKETKKENFKYGSEY